MSHRDGIDVDKLDKFGLLSGFCCTIESDRESVCTWRSVLRAYQSSLLGENGK